ncbi:tumor necrosis factor receptor superfamily member 5 isoform 2-T4 [Clarias gariepinus]|uniref:tumor necrosis factor receptor superfamily member 14-like isoform X2 n=1 Tax=Clarias gariepinus TaxID=13013 RepID=UPI00234D5699|nr:tumor necrosis factor receptor superfamily member 14-like isoform X2 [Clarias gariepinus]
MCFEKIMKPTSLTLRLYIFGVYSVLTYGCGPSEYLSRAGECCPMCNIGSVVYKDCTGDYSTSCKPCSTGTFMNLPNGLNKCLQCKVCDSGLSILKRCITTKNTICKVSDGYYCLDYIEENGDCIRAVEHSKCTPGQYIKTPGTKASDTVCEPCPPGSYSPEGVNCTKWTDCSDNNEVKTQEGTSITDVKCKRKTNRSHLIVVPAVGILLSVLLTIFLFALRLRPANEGSKKLKAAA